MERLEFIEKIFTLYRVNPDNNKELIRIYDDAFSTRQPVDWDKLYRNIINSAEGGLPKPAFFVSKFDSCLKDADYQTPDGLRLRVNLKDGCNYEYETYKTDYTLPEIKQRFRKYFNNNFESIALFDDVKLQWVTI